MKNYLIITFLFTSSAMLFAQNKIGLLTSTPEAPVHIGSSGQVNVPGGLLLLGHRSEGHMELDFNLIQSKYSSTSGLDLRINPMGGDVGIHTNFPDAPFHIFTPGQVSNPTGSFLIGNRSEAHLEMEFNYLQSRYNNGTLKFEIQPNGGDLVVGNNLLYVDDSKQVGIGTDNPMSHLHLASDAVTTRFTISRKTNGISNAEIRLVENSSGSLGTSIRYEGLANELQILGYNNGDVGPHFSVGRNTGLIKIPYKLAIGNYGSVPNGYSLAVDGKIRSEGLKCDLSQDWADFVFEEDYDLLPISEVETFIETNGHLPGFVSAKNMKENGIDFEDITTRQQQKIEELMLYIIELKNEVDALKKTSNKTH